MEKHTPAPAETDPLEALRLRIDDLDRLIIGMIHDRTTLTLAIADEKRARGLTTLVPGRETEVVKNYIASIPEDSPLTAGDATEVAETVMRTSRRAQDSYRQQLDAQDAEARDALSGLATQVAAERQQR